MEEAEGRVIPFPSDRVYKDRLLSYGSLSAALGRKRRWLEYRVAEGMPSVLEEGQRRFDLNEVRAWLARNTEGREI